VQRIVNPKPTCIEAGRWVVLPRCYLAHPLMNSSRLVTHSPSKVTVILRPAKA